jgi:hypothetical protein
LEWIESLKIVREAVSKEMRRDDEQSRSKGVVINGVNCKQVQRIAEDLLNELLISKAVQDYQKRVQLAHCAAAGKLLHVLMHVACGKRCSTCTEAIDRLNMI